MTPRREDDIDYARLIGDVVRRRRDEMKLTQEQLAEHLERDRLYVYRLERGNGVSLTPDVIEDLCTALIMPVSSLSTKALATSTYSEVTTRAGTSPR